MRSLSLTFVHKQLGDLIANDWHCLFAYCLSGDAEIHTGEGFQHKNVKVISCLHDDIPWGLPAIVGKKREAFDRDLVAARPLPLLPIGTAAAGGPQRGGPNGPPLLPANRRCVLLWVGTVCERAPSSETKQSTLIIRCCEQPLSWLHINRPLQRRTLVALSSVKARERERERWTRVPVLWSCWGCWSLSERGCALWLPPSYHSGWPCPRHCCLLRATSWACGRPAWSRTSGGWSAELMTACWAYPLTSSWLASSCVRP